MTVLAIWGAAGGAAASDPIALSVQPVAPGAGSANRSGELMWLGGVMLGSRDRRFGGWSGLVVSQAGDTVLAVGDAGDFLTADVERTAAGGVAMITNPRLGRIADRTGAPLRGKSAGDAEALVVLPEALTSSAGGINDRPDRGPGFARLLVAFEQGGHRLWRYDPIAGPSLEGRAVNIPVPLGIRNRASNGGLETLAVLPDGRLLAIAERVDGPDSTKKAWTAPADLWRPGRPGGWRDWRPFFYRPTGPGFRPVDAAVVPPGGTWAGQVLILERRFSPPGGLAVRVARIDPAGIADDKVMVGLNLGTIRAPWPTDNYEGLAIHRDRNGRAILILISDDNFNRVLQRTLLIALGLMEPPPSRAQRVKPGTRLRIPS